MDKQQIEQDVIAAIRPCEGNTDTMISALSNYLPFEWNWVRNQSGILNITSEAVDIEIRGKNVSFQWKG
jgi:hypothetical protein